VIVVPSPGALCTSNVPPPTWARLGIIAAADLGFGRLTSNDAAVAQLEHDRVLPHADPEVCVCACLREFMTASRAMWNIAPHRVASASCDDGETYIVPICS
jgi:hypothetical protein